MVTDNLLEFLNDFQKFALKIRIQEVLDTMIKDDRVYEVIDADKVFDYYNKMHEEFAKHPHNFLFPNREWLQDSLKRLNIDVSEIFNAGANADHIKREEIIVLFMLLWVHMKIQDPDSSSDVKTPYDLFIMWIYDRVFISRPTDTRYLQDGDWKVLDRIYDKYGWFTKGHCFTIGAKGAVKYHHSSPDDIANIDGAYNKAHGSVTKLRDMNDWAMSRLTAEQHKLAHHDHRTLYPKSMFRLAVDPEELKKGTIKLGRSKKKTPLVWEHDIESVSVSVKVPDHVKDQLENGVNDFDEARDIIGKLMEDLQEEKERRHNIDRNTKFIVRKMTGMSNKEYKTFLKKFKEKEEMRCYDWLQCFEDIMVISGLELEYEVILEAANQYSLSVYHLNKALLKLKEKLNEGR
nr:MAG TPA: hypothetical protein [Caudoviricetes sp.]